MTVDIAVILQLRSNTGWTTIEKGKFAVWVKHALEFSVQVANLSRPATHGLMLGREFRTDFLQCFLSIAFTGLKISFKLMKLKQ